LLVREASKHDMRHNGELSLHSFEKMRVIVTVYSRPPAADAVDNFPAVMQNDARSVRRSHSHCPRSSFHLGVRQPDMIQPFIKPAGFAHHNSVHEGCIDATSACG
jgi:hypothetical protein